MEERDYNHLEFSLRTMKRTEEQNIKFHVDKLNSVSKLLFRQSFTGARPLLRAGKESMARESAERKYYIDISSYLYSFHNLFT